MAASIGDVAAAAGVSVATVSRALRGLPNVAPSTRARVLAAAAELRYVVDPQASRLAAGRTQTVGMVVPQFTQWFAATVVAGAEGVLAGHGYDLLLYTVSGTESRERFLDTLPFRKRVDGVIILDLPLGTDEWARLAQLGVPMVTVGLRCRQLSSVTVDNLAGAATAVRHLVDLGHTDIALIAGLPDDPMGFTAPLDRRAGYQQVLAEAGLRVRPELDVPGNFSLAGGAEAMAQLLAGPQRPTAVFAESDEMAIGALKAVGDAGLAAPGDISVVGFDDHEMAEFVGLTTIAQPVMTQGETAASLLLRCLAEGDEQPAHVVLPTTLRQRATTGPVPRGRRRTRRESG